MALIRSLAASVLIFAGAAQADPWVVRAEWISAHENFLASDVLQGRGSATRDELIAATYIAAQFESYGLKPAPGMKGWLQRAEITRQRFQGEPKLAFGAQEVAKGVTLFVSNSQPLSGRIVQAGTEDPKALTSGQGDVLLVTGPAPLMAWYGAAGKVGAKLVIARESDATRAGYAEMGGEPRLLRSNPAQPRQRAALITVPEMIFVQLAAAQGQTLSFTPPPVVDAKLVTTNAIGYLPGSDRAAGTLLFTAHLDHLGGKADGTVMHGANDDASGTVAVLELARALASGGKPRRSILFVCYGGEEMGLLGARYFTEHPPVPLQEIVANLEFEMIGAQDPQLPQQTLMMTGFERSDFGEALQRQGFRVTADPYPQQQFFQRSDNYQLAQMGIVAHTVSGWATTPTYHSADDDIAHLDLPFMTAVIQSVIESARWLVNSDFVPQWKPGGKP
ncbi:MAG: M20/M25/M40 family metallo-hydrolase [Paucibacter sp.]|nr:M20/M25/M40 family metallo-hydrolase [Roseateles sp.]